MTAMLAPVLSDNVLLPIGRKADGSEVFLNLERLLSGRMLVQGSSGAGKSETLRVLVEEAFEYVTVMIVDPEGEFSNLAAHIGATTILASEITNDGLTAAAIRGRTNRLALHLDLSDLGADDRITKAAAFFTGLTESPRETWGNTVLVMIDEAHLMAPHMAASARDAETRRLGVAALTELCARGRKRGVAAVVATQRLSKLATSVVSELHNVLIGLNVFDRDIARAADLLGLSGRSADELSKLLPGEFFILGPALTSRPCRAIMRRSSTQHLGATPELLGPADTGAEEAGRLLDLDGLKEIEHRPAAMARGHARALDAFLLHPAGAAAMRTLDALRRIAPNATTNTQLQGHLALDPGVVDDALDLLASVNAVDTVPRGAERIARLSSRLRLKTADVAVVGLS